MDLLYVYDDKIAATATEIIIPEVRSLRRSLTAISLSLTRSHSLCAERLSAPTICRRSPG